MKKYAILLCAFLTACLAAKTSLQAQEPGPHETTQGLINFSPGQKKRAGDNFCNICGV